MGKEFTNFIIEKSNFNYYPDIELIDGSRGKIKSKIESTYLGNLEFSLQSFTIDLKTGKFVSNQSLLNGNKLKQIKGAMEYIPPKSQPKHNNLFNFISYNTDAEITVNNNTKLITGVSIKEDLFYSSSLSGENALKGADIGIYLVHSMQPSTRLSQGKFEDTDLLLADNFSLAAQKNNLKQIIYLGGILPKDKNEISKHLSSRYEVEKTLGSRNIPLTAIRAGIIIGPGGSSFKIITSLIKNLPIMACPKWTKSKNQPIDVFDVLNIIKKSIGNKLTFNKKIEIGGPERR